MLKYTIMTRNYTFTVSSETLQPGGPASRIYTSGTWFPLRHLLQLAVGSGSILTLPEPGGPESEVEVEVEVTL
jgi:hypothetical protein